MIKSKEDLKLYMNADKVALGMNKKRIWTLILCRSEKDYILKYQRLLRRTEYVKNCLLSRNMIFIWWFKILTYKLLRSKIKLGFDIPPNVFGPGLCIVHIGPIIIRGWATVGKNCVLQPMTNIGMDGRNDGPEYSTTIGDNCYISMGAKIIGNITIASNTMIGAGAVVVKDILEEGTSWGGVPAKKLC